ncbi:glycosyltransferase, partial [Vibrio parahaemolyticus]
EEAVENIVRQETNFSFKLFIGDDNSTDGTKEKCINLRNKYSEKIELFINEKNIGAINNGLKIHKECILSGAKYIAFCEGDDYWLG